MGDHFKFFFVIASYSQLSDIVRIFEHLRARFAAKWDMVGRFDMWILIREQNYLVWLTCRSNYTSYQWKSLFRIFRRPSFHERLKTALKMDILSLFGQKLILNLDVRSSLSPIHCDFVMTFMSPRPGPNRQKIKLCGFQPKYLTGVLNGPSSHATTRWGFGLDTVV